jgi:hypothetical protein
MAGVLVVGEAQPLPVSAQINIAAIKQAVAEEDGVIIEAIDHQSEVIADLVADQALLIQTLEQETAVSETDSSPAPTIVTVPVESGIDSPWVALAAGLAVGLAFAALMTARRSHRRADPLSSSEGLQASLES